MARPTQQEIDEFNARMDEPEDDLDDFEIEIYNPDGHGARIPYRKGRSYLQQHFGIDLDEQLPAPDQNGNPANAGKGRGATKGKPPTGNNPVENENPDVNNDNPTRTSQRYFGRR